MRKKLLVPYGVGEPPGGVEALLPPDAGLVLDAGPTWSESGEGQLVVTTVGVLAIDPESGDMAGIRWEHFDPPLQLDDLETHASLTFVVQGCGAIVFGIERELAGNIWALAYQFQDLDDGDVIDGLIVADQVGTPAPPVLDLTSPVAHPDPPGASPDQAPPTGVVSSTHFDPAATVRVVDELPPPPDLSWDTDAPADRGQRQRQRRRWLRVGTGAG